MSLLTSINGGNPTSPYFWPYEAGPGIPGPVGPPGPAGPIGAVGPQGDYGANSYGTWLYNTNNPPAPQDLFLGPSTLVINYTSELPGGLEFLRGALALFNANGGTITISFTQEQGTFGPVSVALQVSAFTLDDITGLATLTFTYVGGAVPPFVWAVGQSVDIISVGGAQGPQGPTGPAGTPGGNDWWNYPAEATVDLSGNDIIGVGDISAVNISMTGDISGVDDITMTGDISGATSITTGGAVAAASVSATGAIAGNSVSATTTVSGADLSASTAIAAPTMNAATGVNIYPDLLAGGGNLQVGSPNPLAANPGNISLNGTLYQQRGFCNASITASGLYIDGPTIIPGTVGFEIGSIPVAGINTCRLSVNTPTSLSSIVGIAPLGITFDSGAACNLSAVGTAQLSAGGPVVLQSLAQEVYVQGGALTSADLIFTNGGSIDNLGNLFMTGSIDASGDVVSSHSVNNYSLNTIGANYNIVGGFYKTSDQSAPTGATDITWDASYNWGDALNCFTIVPGSAAITCAVRGVYEIAVNMTNATGTSTAAATNIRILSFDLTRAPNPRLNGFITSTFYNQTNASYNQVVQGVVELLVGDVLDVRVQQSLSGGSSLILGTSGIDPNCWMTYSLRKRLP
jgi:hypothetical protein